MVGVGSSSMHTLSFFDLLDLSAIEHTASFASTSYMEHQSFLYCSKEDGTTKTIAFWNLLPMRNALNMRLHNSVDDVFKSALNQELCLHIPAPTLTNVVPAKQKYSN